MTKAGLFYHNMRHLLKNKKNSHIVLNKSWYPIPQAKERRKQYTAHDVNRDDCAKLFQNIASQPVKQILHTVDNYILQNFPILWEYVRMYEDIYVPIVPYL